MNIKQPNANHSIIALATYQRTEQIILRCATVPSPVSPTDIIDCIEIQTATNTHMPHYIPLANTLTKDKGVFVNVWV